jgi:hypothetical protein
MLREGHWRLGKSMVGKARYLVAGLDNTVKIPWQTIADSSSYRKLGDGVNDCVVEVKISLFGSTLLHS